MNDTTSSRMTSCSSFIQGPLKPPVLDMGIQLIMSSQGFWQTPVSRPIRPWSSVILPGTVKEDLLSDVKKFLGEKEIAWYAARGEFRAFAGNRSLANSSQVFPIVVVTYFMVCQDPARAPSVCFENSAAIVADIIATAIASHLRLDIYIINPSLPGSVIPASRARMMLISQDGRCQAQQALSGMPCSKCHPH